MRIVHEEVISTALNVLNTAGIEGLTMRKLAEAMHIQAPSLYWHFANKEILLEEMANTLMAPVARNNPAKESWDTRLSRILGEIRQALLSHRDGARVFAGTHSVSENMVRIGSLLTECLKKTGMDDRTAIWSVFSLVYFVIGFCIEEQALPGKILTNKRDTPILLKKYPLTALTIREISTKTANKRFSFGLSLQIESLKRIADQNPKKAP